MKERPILFSAPMVRAILSGAKTQTRRLVKPQPTSETATWGCVGGKGFGFLFGGDFVRCPYGTPGDRLWVRETWAEIDTGFIYRASDEDHNPGQIWRPSIFMRRVATRIRLEVMGVRVERLKAITEADARAEGVGGEYHCSMCRESPRREFQRLWDLINGKRAPWETNPWVWVVEFKRVRP